MRQLTATCADGVEIVADAYGPREGVPVLCLPGLTRNARDFENLARSLAQGEGGRRVIVLESRGRGRSGRGPAATYTLTQELSDLVAACDAWQIGSADIVGTSRGGLLAMALAATAPSRVGAVVLNDVGPVLEERGLARIGESVGARMSYPSFEAFAAALRRSLETQFPRLSEVQSLRLARQLASPTARGAVVLDYDPAIARAFAGGGSGPSPDFWPAFMALRERRVLVIRGAHSDLLSAATVEAMRRRHPSLATLVVADEGHPPLLWDRASVEAIRAFLN